MTTQPLSYEQPLSSVILIEVAESVLGDDKSGGSGTEPIIDDGSSHGWG